MAKKAKKTEMVEVEPQIETMEEVVTEFFEETVVAEPKIKKPVMETPKPKKETWEVKDRIYFLKGGLSPLTYTMKTKGLFWFDEEKGHQREVKYCPNQRTVFVDEMVGNQMQAHMIFYDGEMRVAKEDVMLQKLLSLYHPLRDNLYEEWKPQKEAAIEVEDIEIELEALNTAMNMEIDLAEAIMRVEVGSKVSQMSSKEIKRDLLLYAKNNPDLFLELANDENVVLRNFGIKATELGLLKLSSDQRTFSWGSTDRKLMNVPFEEHPYTALAAWFKTDEGMEIYTNIEKQMK